MIVKSFAADTVAGALKLARKELGGEAVILKTRRVEPAQQNLIGGKVEVTACVARPGAEAAVAPVVQYDIESGLQAARFGNIPAGEIARKLDFLLDVLQTPVRREKYPDNFGNLFAVMLQADIPEVLARVITDRLSERMGAGAEYEDLSVAAANLLLEQIPRKKSKSILGAGQRVVLIGPSGAGKSSLMGRLAANLVCRQKTAVTLSSLDQVKITAVDELHTYAEALDVKCFDMPREINRELVQRESKDRVVIIDTPGLNTRDSETITLFEEKIRRLNADRVVAVFPAWFRSSDLRDLLHAYRNLGVTELAFTMMDQTHRLGAVVAAAIHTGLPITMLGTGRKADHIDLDPDYPSIVATIFARGVTNDHE